MQKLGRVLPRKVSGRVLCAAAHRCGQRSSPTFVEYCSPLPADAPLNISGETKTNTVREDRGERKEEGKSGLTTKGVNEERAFFLVVLTTAPIKPAHSKLLKCEKELGNLLVPSFPESLGRRAITRIV